MLANVMTIRNAFYGTVDDMKGFRDLLRMSVEDFSHLLDRVTPIIQKQDAHLTKAISPKDRLSVTLRFLATGETFNSLSFQYRIGSTTLSRIVMETCTALTSVLREDFLKTPGTEPEWKAIAKDFHDKWQFPHCLGAVDGKHIFIQPSANSGSMYYNYKSRFSIILMAVVDANYKFVYASAGTQGRVSDAGVFAQSDLRAAMDKGLLHVPPDDTLPNTDILMPYMFIGDEAYLLRADLMKPYPFQNLNRSQRLFNYRLSRARRVVENAFGILASHFRVFRTTISLDPDKVMNIIFACLCLHNFLRDRRSDAYLPPAYVDSEDANHQLIEGSLKKNSLTKEERCGKSSAKMADWCQGQGMQPCHESTWRRAKPVSHKICKI
uniref:protein ANTAGONIST OF LIKE HETEROCHROMATIN PROTEIN 1-like isoform X2 n=1 Tax=Epinephelus lanceolatus TaxID=310571 RepID=UPI0014473788|nr:protein ANTAGONIST OF LIKE HETEROCHROMATIN PROTEIN 1-like isoform X2 [Epinephelus lanceolatus]